MQTPTTQATPPAALSEADRNAEMHWNRCRALVAGLPCAKCDELSLAVEVAYDIAYPPADALGLRGAR